MAHTHVCSIMPMMLPKKPSKAPSREKRRDTPLRFKPKARRVPISLVLSRMAIPIVFTVVITTITKTMEKRNVNIILRKSFCFEKNRDKSSHVRISQLMPAAFSFARRMVRIRPVSCQSFSNITILSADCVSSRDWAK